jgi:hypothetical protein
MRKALLGIAAVGLAAASSAWLSTGGANYTKLDRAGEPLRETFNADLGKVRVLMLVAPT